APGGCLVGTGSPRPWRGSGQAPSPRDDGRCRLIPERDHTPASRQGRHKDGSYAFQRRGSGCLALALVLRAELATGGGDLDATRVADRHRDVARFGDEAGEAVDALVIGALEFQHVDRIEGDHVDVAEAALQQLAELAGDLVA